MIQFNKLEKIFIFLVIILGSLILFFPVHYLLFAFIGLIILIFLLFKPVTCFYLTVFSLPLAQLGLTSIFGHGLQPYNIFYHICLVAVFFDFLNKKKINISTKLDKWFLVLAVIILFAGFISPDSFNGMSIALRYIKAILLFYMTVYLFRTKQIKLSTILKIMIASAIIQVVLVVCPFISHYFVQPRPTLRGYLGLLGIGPLLVYQARGTFAMFSDFGYYLDVIIFLMLPMYRNIYKNKILGWGIIGFLFVGVFLSYSRGAIAVLIVSSFYYSLLTSENKRTFFKKHLGIIFSSIAFFLYFIFKTDFLNTLNSRNDIWDIHLTYIRENINSLWFGNGWDSFAALIQPYLPGNISFEEASGFLPHNYYIFLLEELGIIGGLIFLSFLIYVFVDSFINSSKGKKIQKNLNISLSITMLIVFIAGIYDQSFYHPHLFTILMFIFALVYTKKGSA